MGPVSRLYYFLTSGLSRSERQERDGLYGTWKDGFQNLKPHLLDLEDGRRLLEIPVTTMPFFRLPIHASYLLYLATYSPALSRFYFRLALWLCRLTRTAPSFLLHPTDFLGSDDAPEMSYFPAMNQTSSWKVARTREFLEILNAHFKIVTMKQHAQYAIPPHPAEASASLSPN